MDRQCSSCGGFCKKSGCERENDYVKPKEWQGLTDEERIQVAIDSGCRSADWVKVVEAVEAKLKEKNI